MDKILFLDTSVASLNKGDEIIMECVKNELKFLTDGKFILNIPTHLTPFDLYQVWRNSLRVQVYKNCLYKFVGGSNLLVPNMFTHFPQWNLNLLNYQSVKDCILVGVGAGSGDKTNLYTRMLYQRLLNNNFYHSVRDERTKIFLNNMGFKSINTGCVTMWMLTPEFCKTIPTKKAKKVIFTLTASAIKDERDQLIIDVLNKNYSEVYFWVQGIDDYEYLHQFINIEDITIVNPMVEDYKKILESDDIDYVGTRLHAGVYAMRHGRRAIIIAIDERAREINKCNNLNCLEKNKLGELSDMINSNVKTDVKMPLENIEKWRNQFKVGENIAWKM